MAPVTGAAAGSTTAVPAGSGGGSRTFPCPACGADLQFSIGVQDLECPYCGHVEHLARGENEALVERDLAAALRELGERRAAEHPPVVGSREIDCPSCGATVRFDGTLTSGECAWCGSPLQVEGAHDAGARIPVDGVLPFLVDRPTAHERLAAWIRSRWFAPNEFLRRGVEGRFEGVYMPYWTFDSMTFTRYRGERGDAYWVTVGSGKNRRRVRRIRWTPAAGSFQRFFDDVLVPASTGLPAQRTLELEPWPLGRCVAFDAGLLAGFAARTYDVELEQAFTAARDRIDAAIHAEVRGRIGGDTQRIHSVETAHDAVTFKHLLLPVWLLTYRFADRAYRVLVNAATGEVQGDRPWSWIKIGLATLVAAVAALIVAWFVGR